MLVKTQYVKAELEARAGLDTHCAFLELTMTSTTAIILLFLSVYNKEIFLFMRVIELLKKKIAVARPQANATPVLLC